MTIRCNNYSSQDRNKVLRAQGEEQRKKEEKNEGATSTSRDFLGSRTAAHDYVSQRWGSRCTETGMCIL